MKSGAAMRTWVSPTGELHDVSNAHLYQFCRQRQLNYGNMVDHIAHESSDHKNGGCIYLYIYIYIHVYLHIYLHLYFYFVHMQIHMYILLHMCIPICMHIHVHILIPVNQGQGGC